MNRRGFLKSILAAPVVITTPGLLMPVKALEVPRGPVIIVWDSISNGWVVDANGCTVVETYEAVQRLGRKSGVIPMYSEKWPEEMRRQALDHGVNVRFAS